MQSGEYATGTIAQGRSASEEEKQTTPDRPMPSQSIANDESQSHHNYQHQHPAQNDQSGQNRIGYSCHGQESLPQDHAADGEGHEHDHMGSDRPMFATVTVGVTHCGAGCLLGDIVGEWLVYGSGANIRGRTLWPEFLIGTH